MVEEAPAAAKSRAVRGRWRVAAVLLALVLAATAAATAWISVSWLSDLPQVPAGEALWAMRRSPGMRFVDHDGGFIAVRGARYGVRVGLPDLPAFAPRAFLAAEDRRFYQHGAVDLHGILRAAWRDILLRRAAEGGSTVTQQLARTLFLNSGHTLKRKVQEAALASRLESTLGKDGVLELYLNRAYFGAGAYGLDAASETYFGKPAKALTLAEAALLAAVPNAPSRLAPSNNMPGAWARARRILAVMQQQGWITAEERATADASPPSLARGGGGEGDWSYVLDQAAAQAAARVAGSTDLVVRLTVDAKLQASGLASVRALVLGEGARRGVSQGALVALASDGAIRAMVAGLDHRGSAFNRVTQARRQPGSAFKAFVFGAALESGVRPEDTRQDAPISLGDWAPGNYGGRYGGAVTLARALALSINSVAVRLTLEVGPAQVAAFARRCGLMDIPVDPGPSIALGAYEVTLLELASGYQVFQSGGNRVEPYLIETIADTAGRTLYAHDPGPARPVLDPLHASRMVRMLEGVVTGGTGAGAAIGRPAAGKTGTSQRWRDAWFVGFTPDLLAAVWVGNDDGRPMAKVTGGELPAAIWRRFMLGATAGTAAADFTWLLPEPAPPPPDATPTDADAGAPAMDEPPALDEAAPPPRSRRGAPVRDPGSVYDGPEPPAPALPPDAETSRPSDLPASPPTP